MAIKDDLKTIMTTSMTNYAREAYNRFAKVGDFNTLSGKVNTLIGNVSGDDAKSVRTISAEEVAKIVAGADTDYDTLKEIADWIKSDTTGAAKMASDIQALISKTLLGTHEVGGEQVEYSTVKAYVEAMISEAGLSGSAAISIANNVVSLIVDTSNANGLTVDTNGLKLGLASASTNGALSSTDWSTFNGKQEQVVVAAASGTGNVVTSVSLNADGKTIEQTKGITALQVSDFEALTAAECAAIFDAALQAASGSSGS